jgi:hypothetical protein
MEERYTHWYVLSSASFGLDIHGNFIAFPHYIAVDDEYRGYRIPAGSLVIGNTWFVATLIGRSSQSNLMNVSCVRAILHDKVYLNLLHSL